MSYPVRRDPVSGRRLLRALLLFAASVVCVFAALFWADAGGNGTWGDRPRAVAVGGSLLFMVASTSYVVYVRVLMGSRYRCPACGTRTASPPPTVADEGTPIRHRCDRCRVEWDTGWKHARSVD
jgi:hypothetical protein